MFQTPTRKLREKLLSVHGIGPETADSILLYAGNHPVFVVDAYTHRIFGRHGLVSAKPDYEAVRAVFEGALPPHPQLFNEFHALIVNTGKNWCRKSAPRCSECPLRHLLPADSPFSQLLAPNRIRRFVVRGFGVSTSRKSQILLALGGVAIVLLLAAVFTLGSLTLPFQPPDLDQAILYALSTFIVAALLVFRFDPDAQPGAPGRGTASRTSPAPDSKQKWYWVRLRVSFLPVVFLFFVSYALAEPHSGALVSAPPGNRHAIQPRTGRSDEPRRRRAHVGNRQGSRRGHGRRYRAANDSRVRSDLCARRGSRLGSESERPSRCRCGKSQF